MNRAPLLLLVAAASTVHADVPTAPSFRTAAAWSRGASLLGDLSEGEYQGRRLFVREATLVVAPSDRLAFWLGESETTVFGRASDSRFRLHADRQAARWRLGPYRGTEFALGAQRIGTTDGVATSPRSTAVYRGTRLISGEAIATRGRYDAALGLGRVDTSAEDATTVSLSLGTRQRLAPRLSLWAQGTVVGQSFGGSHDAKLALRGQVEYRPVAWGAITLSGTLFPNGLPFDEALGSFLLYDPAGTAAQGLRHDAIGFGTLRLAFSARF